MTEEQEAAITERKARVKEVKTIKGSIRLYDQNFSGTFVNEGQSLKPFGEDGFFPCEVIIYEVEKPTKVTMTEVKYCIDNMGEDVNPFDILRRIYDYGIESKEQGQMIDIEVENLVIKNLKKTIAAREATISILKNEIDKSYEQFCRENESL